MSSPEKFWLIRSSINANHSQTETEPELLRLVLTYHYLLDSHRSLRMQPARKWRREARSILLTSPEGKRRDDLNSSELILTIIQ